ncbi:MAG: hypothetical protein AAF321_01935 [Pseudomonadota bacterium]
MLALTMFIPVIVLAVASVSALRRAKETDPLFIELTTPRWQRRR